MTVIPLDRLGALVVLALTDSLSVGTLLVPVWLLTVPGRIRAHRVLIYLSAVLTAYVAIGVALLAGGRTVLDRATGILDTPGFSVAQFVVGAALFISSFAFDTKAARVRAAARAQSGTGRLLRWRDRAMADQHSTGPLIVLGFGAVLIEVASMLPYIAATGIIASHTSTWVAGFVALVAYCVVMVAPAVVLTVARVTAKGLVEAPLRRLERWLTLNARTSTLWIIGIAGFFLAATAVQNLGWTQSSP